MVSALSRSGHIHLDHCRSDEVAVDIDIVVALHPLVGPSLLHAGYDPEENAS
jgi:hypothetical protein